MMTVEQYKAFKRLPAENRPIDQCRAADEFVKHETIKRLKAQLDTLNTPTTFKRWAVTLARLHYDSIETDEMFKAMGAYPDWL